MGEAKGLRGVELARQVDEVIRQTRIDDVAHRRISALSKGYKQRVGIAQALLGDPKVIILDEPTVGLDPIQIVEIRDLIKELGQTHTVIFSSHILSEVQAICDQILIISKGKLVAFDAADDLEKLLLAPNEIHIVCEGDEGQIQDILCGLEQVSELTAEVTDAGYVSARIKTELDDVYQLSRAVFSAFARSGAALLEMSVKRADLEEVFLELTESAAAETSPDTAAEIEEREAADE